MKQLWTKAEPQRRCGADAVLLWVIITLAGLFFRTGATLRAQECRITGEVSSALTQEGVARAVVRLMTADGKTLLATDTTRYRMIVERSEHGESAYPDKYSGAVFSFVVPLREGYRIVVEARDYEMYDCRIGAEAGKTVRVPPVSLVPRVRERQLGEAVVKGTRIKMFYEGDTLVYNADAFNVAQTESLRKLVEQLPGAELTDGEVRVHGKRVDNLLVSGKDFFNGNVQAALDNLPAYIVSRIKVYDKAGELSELTGQDMHDESYVMDVRLKRKYTGVWMGKLSADGGTEGFWGGQGFLMRFDDRQMFSLNADVNNFSQDRQMSDVADTQDSYPSGQVSTRTARFSYYMEPDKTWRFTSGGSVSRRDNDGQSWRNVRTYLSPANLMSRSTERYDGEEVAAEASAAVRARRQGRWQHSLDYTFNYARSRTARDSHGLSFYLPGKTAWEGLPLDSIIRLEESDMDTNALLHSLLEPALVRSRGYTHRPTWKSVFVAGGDLLNVNIPLKHSVQTLHDFSNYRLTTYGDGAADTRRRYRNQRDYALDVVPELEWVHRYERLRRFDGVVRPFVRYSYRRGTARRPEYRLERMKEWSDQLGWGLESLGYVPQTDWQALCLDEANSYYSVERDEKAEAGAAVSHKMLRKGGAVWQADASVSLFYRRRRLDYSREGADYSPSRAAFFCQPDLTLRWKYESREGRTWMPEWEAGYQGKPSMPASTLLLPIRDASDPLNRFVGNGAQANPFTHRVRSVYRLQHVASGRSFNLSAAYRRLHNDIATRSIFDAATGIRTYMPVNTARTHSVQGRTEFSSALDAKKRFYLSVSLTADYYQAENLSFLSSESTAGDGMIRNVGLTPNVTLRATIGNKFRFYGRWSTAFRHVDQPSVRNDYRETTLYGDLSYTLPWDIRFGTLLRTTFYAGNSLNVSQRAVTDWNATLSKYFLEDRLGVHFRANNLLARSGIYNSEMTAANYMESYADVLPRYFMLSVSYSFKWTGKK